MAAVELGVAYLSLVVSTKDVARDVRGAFGNVETEAAASGTRAGTAVAESASRALAAQSGLLRTAMKGLLVAPIATIKSFASGAKAELDAIGGKSAALTLLRDRAYGAGAGLRSLVGKSTGLQAVRTAAAGAVGSLGGISSLLGAAGPWGLALAGAGLALNGFQQAQENARVATEALTGSLDAQTGALTAKSLELIGAALQEDISHADEWAKLNEMGFGFEKTLEVLAQGGPALDDYIAKLKAVGAQQGPNAHLARDLATSIGNQTEQMVDATSKFNQRKTLLAAVAGASKGANLATKDLADSTSAATAGQGALADQARDAARALEDQRKTLLAGKDAMFTMHDAVDKVREAIAKTPRNVTVTASGVGFTQLMAQIDAARKALAILTGKGFGDSIAADGERHGADASNPTDSARKAYEKAKRDSRRFKKIQDDLDKAIKDHNKVAVDTRADEAAAKRGQKAAAAAAQSAREKAQQAMASAQESLKSNISSRINSVASAVTPNITALPKTAPGIRRALERALRSIRTFRSNINALAKRGLPKVFLQQLLDAGLDGAATAQALMSSSGKDFAAIKDLSQRIQKQSTGLGRDSIGNIFGTGQNAIKLLVNGMDSQQQLVDKQATKVARSFNRAFSRQYGGPSVAGAPKPHAAKASTRTANGGALVNGDLIINNPKPQTAGESATTGLRKSAFLLGAA